MEGQQKHLEFVHAYFLSADDTSVSGNDVNGLPLSFTDELRLMYF